MKKTVKNNEYLILKTVVIIISSILVISFPLFFINVNTKASGGDYAVGIMSNGDNTYRLIGYHKASDIGTELLNNCSDTKELWEKAVHFAAAGSSSNEIEIHLWCDLSVDVGTDDFLYNLPPGWDVVIRTEEPESTGKYTLTVNGQGNNHPLFGADCVKIHSLNVVDNRISRKDVGIAEAVNCIEVLNSDIWCNNADEIIRIDNNADLSSLRIAYSLIDGTTSCKSGVYLNSRYGEISGSIIKNCTLLGIESNADTFINNTIIHNDSCGILNNGILRIEGEATDIYDNLDVGINNNGVIYHRDGRIRDNGLLKADSSDSCCIGVYQNGEYHISGNGSVASGSNRDNAIFLLPGRNVNVEKNGEFNGFVILTMPISDRIVGKELVLNGSNNEDNFQVGFYEAERNSDGSNFDGVDYCGKKALVRSGTHNNLNPTTSLYLSAAYYLTYDANSLKKRSANPASYTKDVFLWNESFLAKFGTNKYIATGEGKRYIQTGWSKRSDSDNIEYDMTDRFISGLSSHTTYYAVYGIEKRERGRINYNANGACDDSGNEYDDILDGYETSLDSDYIMLSGSIFGKEQYSNNTYVKGEGEISSSHNSSENDIYYYTTDNEIVNDMGSKELLASFHGWAPISYIKKNDNVNSIVYAGVCRFIDIFYDAQAVGLLGFIDKPENMSVKEIATRIVDLRNKNVAAWISNEKGDLYNPIEDNGVVDVYAIWDMYPELITKRISITEDELDRGLTEKDLLKKVRAIDKEDGDITDKVKVEELDNTINLLKEVQASKYTNYITVAYTVTDSANNTTKAFARVYLNSNTPVNVYYPNGEMGGYVRTINKHAYDTHDYELGGCIPDSIWYIDPEYISLMERGFENLKNNNPIMSYTYTKEDRVAMQEHIHTGNISRMYYINELQWYVDNYMDTLHETRQIL